MKQDDQRIRFRCPSCSATMRAMASEAGEKRKCPKCQSAFRIPKGKSTKPKAATAKAAKPKREKQPLVPVVCGVCSTRVYANLNQVGTSVECPDCYTQNLVKPPTKKPKTGPDLSEVGAYDLAPAQKIEIIDQMGEALLDDADEIVQKEMDEAPKMPSKPFLQGIFTYPLRASVLPTLIGMAMGWSFMFLIVDGAWGLEGFASAVAPIVLALAGFVAVLVVIPSFVTFQNIMENGANGDDDSEIRPDGGLFGMVDWLVDILPIAISATLCCVPTLGLVHVLLLTTGDAGPAALPFGLAAGYAAFQIFPFIFLSMLENNSIMGVFSAEIWSSIGKRSSSWFKFWAIATVLFVAMSATIFSCMKIAQMDFSGIVIAGTIAAMSALICLLAIYFRVLGRLAFVLTSETPAKGKRSNKEDRPTSEQLEVSASV